MGEAGWRKHVQSRPWTPELIKLPDASEHDEPVEMVAVCDRSGAPKVAVRRVTLLQAHRERGEILRAKLEQRRQDLALAETLSSFGSSGSPPPSSHRSSPRAGGSPQGESSYVQHVDLGGNVNFRNRRDPKRALVTPTRSTLTCLVRGTPTKKSSLVNTPSRGSHLRLLGWLGTPPVHLRPVHGSEGLGPASGEQAWERQYSPVGGSATPQGVARSMSSPLAGDGSCPMTQQEMQTAELAAARESPSTHKLCAQRPWMARVPGRSARRWSLTMLIVCPVGNGGER